MRAGNDPGAHLVDEVKHLRFVGVLVLLDAVLLQRLGCAAAALVKGGEEPRTLGDLLLLVVVHATTVHPDGPARQLLAGRPQCGMSVCV